LYSDIFPAECLGKAGNRSSTMKAIEHHLAIVEEQGDDTRFTLRRDETGRVWVATWEVSRHGHGGAGSPIYPKDFDSVMVKGRSLRVLVEAALGKIGGAGVAASVQRRRKQ
jgi:hypothetical protein